MAETLPNWIDNYPGVRRLLQGEDALLYDADGGEVLGPRLAFRQIAILDDAAYRAMIREAAQGVVEACADDEEPPL
jgi:hypothetical protein